MKCKLCENVSIRSQVNSHYLLGDRAEETGRVSRQHLAVQAEAGQVLIHVHKVLLQTLLHPSILTP